MNDLGWWWAKEHHLPHDDGRAVVVGETHTMEVPPPIVPCKRGFHSSDLALDALEWATGPLLYRVRRSGVIVPHACKFASSERTYLAVIDATMLLRRFACDQALSVIDRWDAPEVVKQYLTTMDEEIQNAARDAAWAAWATTRNAARATAWAAWATRDAAWATARDAFEQQCLAAIGNV